MFEPADQSRRSTSVVCPQEGGNCNVAVLRRVDFYATRSVEPFCSKQDMPSESESESALGDRESDVETDAADTGLSSEVPRIQSAPSTDYGQKSPIFGGHSPMLGACGLGLSHMLIIDNSRMTMTCPSHVQTVK
eukprot:SAG31_NODE_496_length_14862_cov_9.280837_2_plen_134_part_00